VRVPDIEARILNDAEEIAERILDRRNPDAPADVLELLVHFGA
jgi:hypothetical protein